MALSDCPKCWDTPCTCGQEYKSWSLERLEQLAAVIQAVIDEKRRGNDEAT